MNNEGVYLKEVEIKDIKCFKGTHKISFTKPDGEPFRWNIVLGNNNTGKTTILKILASLDFEQSNSFACPTATIRNELINEFLVSAKFNALTDWYFWKTNDSSLTRKAIPFSYHTWEKLKNLLFYGYGISRKISETNISNNSIETNYLQGIFNEKVEYINTEEWLLQLDYGQKNSIKEAKVVFSKIKEIIINGLLPDVKDIELISEIDRETNSIQNYALFHTDYGKVRLKDLGYGYQSTLTWVVDLAKKMFEKYPKLENPLTGSAIVLIDEIDLHLHPDWQRKLIKYLTNIFPNVQFIVTAHSPLVIQSADDINLIILEKNDDNVHIRQEFGTFQGWTIEEILQNLMGMGEKTISDKYLTLLKQFEEGIDEENYEKAKIAYDSLDKILHSTSSQRKLLKLQLGSIAPAYT